MGNVDTFKFERRRKAPFISSDYEFRRTSCCDAWCVEDVELNDLYFNGADLSAAVSLLRSPDEKDIPCPLCGSETWTPRPVDDLDELPDAWRWARHPR
jgi:hypothetical protein